MQPMKFFKSLGNRKLKGFTLGQLPTVFLTIMFIGVILGATYITLSSFQNTQSNTSKAYTGIGYVMTFLDNIAANLPTVGIIVFIVILIGVLMYLRIRTGKGGA